MVNIASVSFFFDQVEDRIRLIGNLENQGPRVDFWLTRRLVIRLLELSLELVQKTSQQVNKVPVQHQGAMAQFEHDQAQQAPTIQSAESQNHGEHPASILRRLDISFQDGRYRLSFFVHGVEEMQAVSVLSYQELHQTLHWLHRGSLKLDWGSNASLFDGLESSPQRLQ
jgi:hypothetical protein